jgi:cell division protein FtsX
LGWLPNSSLANPFFGKLVLASKLFILSKFENEGWKFCRLGAAMAKLVVVEAKASPVKVCSATAS